jgi:hypothetical protein
MAVPHRTTLALALLLAGCGAGTKPTASPSGFINQTTDATDAQLTALWQQAQQALATQPIPMNPVTSPNDITYAKPDPRALQLQPDGLDVIEMPGAYFPCSESPTGYCAGLTEGPEQIEVAQKYILSAGGTGYEMQNTMLERLGYNVSGR